MDERERQKIEDDILRAAGDWVKPRPVLKFFMGVLFLVIFLFIAAVFVFLGISFYNDNVTGAAERRDSEAQFCESWQEAAEGSPAPDPSFCD